MDALQPYALQVGGHSTQDGLPASLVDERGRFLKQLQAGERGDREVAFYAAVEAVREQHIQSGDRLPGDTGGSSIPASNTISNGDCGEGTTNASSSKSDSSDCSGAPGGGARPTTRSCTTAPAPSSSGQPSFPTNTGLAALCRWIPHSFGVRSIAGHHYLALEDAAAGYTAPCVLDAKIGPRTWYPWAAPDLIAKYQAKDAATSQGSMGFRICGARAQRADGTVWGGDRHWGKGLDRNGVVAALRRFADNGIIPPAAVLGPVLSELQAMAAVFSHQTAVHMFSASVLLLYEGGATTPQEANVAVRLIDFAHAFPEGVHAGGPDTNFCAGLQGIMAAITEALAL